MPNGKRHPTCLSPWPAYQLDERSADWLRFWKWMIANGDAINIVVMPPKTVRKMTLNCPTCAIALSRLSIGGETVDRCNACNGTWYAPATLSSILRGTSPFDSFDSFSVDPPQTIACPKCGIEISSTIYAYDSGIPILKCSECSGVWLVAGQLEEIFNYRNGRHKTDRLGQAIAESYARSNSLNRFAGIVQSRILSVIFAVVILGVAMSLGAETPRILRLLAFLILPLACIWFSDAMGNLTGIRMGLVRPTIVQSTPGIAVALGGWFLMFAVFGVLICGLIGR